MAPRVAPVRKDIADVAERLASNHGAGDPAVRVRASRDAMGRGIVPLFGRARRLQLVSLNIGGQPICTAGFVLLGKSLAKNTHLREIFLYNTSVNYQGP